MGTAREAAVLLVAGERRELAGILARCGRVERLRWGLNFAARAVLNGAPVLAAANGAGGAPAAEAVCRVLERESVRAVLSTGTCGALDPVLKAGEIVVADEIRCVESGQRFVAWRPPGARSCRTGVLLSVNRVVRSAREKAELHAGGGLAVEMEAAGVAQAACERGLAVGAIRVVLDTAEESFHVDFEALRDPSGRFNRWAVIREALAHPASAGREIWRLDRRLRRAADKLGEFLAGLRF